jgi:hypothetical protein
MEPLLTVSSINCRVARGYIFKPKIPIWVNFYGLAMEEAGIFNGHLVYFTDISYGHLVHLLANWYI